MTELIKGETTIQFIFGLDQSEEEERLKFATRLLPELRNLDEIERADRVEDLMPEIGSKPGFATLIGMLRATVSFQNLRGFLGFLGDRLQDKQIRGSIKVGDNQVEFEVKSRQELAEFEHTALNLIVAMGGETNV